AAERLGSRVEVSAPGVVLESRERLARPVAGQQDVSDHAALAGDRVQRQQADARQLGAVAAAVETAEQLVAAADREEGGPGLDRGAEHLALPGEIARYQRLLAVLAAADVEEVDPGRNVRLEADRQDLELVTPESRPLGQDGDVAAVGIDVEVVRIQVTDPERQAATSFTREWSAA